MTGWDVLMFAAMMGAERPATRLRNDAIPVPVPRFGAGNTSGVLFLLLSASRTRRRRAKGMYGRTH